MPSSKKHERYSGKWVCPTYMFNGTNYPRTLSGSGYVMTYGAAGEYERREERRTDWRVMLNPLLEKKKLKRKLSSYNLS